MSKITTLQVHHAFWKFLCRFCTTTTWNGQILRSLENGNGETIGSLSSVVFERRTSTGSEVFSLLTCLDDIKFVFLSFFTTIEAIWLKICAKPPSKNEKRSLPVDVRRSKTLLLKLPNHLNGPLRKQNFSLTGSKGHGLWFVIGGFGSVLCVSVFQGSFLVIVIMIDSSEKRSYEGVFWPLEFACLWKAQ